MKTRLMGSWGGKHGLDACRAWIILALLAAWPFRLHARVLVNEIHFHPASGDVREQFIELLNSGPGPVDLSGWRLAGDVRMELPRGAAIAAGGFLVLASNEPAFHRLHPGVTKVYFGWAGRLSRDGGEIRIENQAGATIDKVAFSDEGDWAVRVRSASDGGHRGWEWSSTADGGGPSLELIQPLLPNSEGQNWAPSLRSHGTPGYPNSRASTHLPPIIRAVAHAPLVPRSSESIEVRAECLDESPGVTALLNWRRDGDPGFNRVPMSSPGSGSGHWYFGVVPPQPAGTVIEFFVSASDESGAGRQWPPLVSKDGRVGPWLCGLIQVSDDTPLRPERPGDPSRLLLVLTRADREELAAINSGSSGSAGSHAQFNATLIHAGGASTELRYQVGVRNRGNSSAARKPPGFRVHFRHDDPWKGVTAINLNSQFTPMQLLGSVLYRRAGLAAAMSRPAHVFVNTSPMSSPGPPNFGFYVIQEVIDSRFAERAFGSDGHGNLYRGMRVSGRGADLSYLGSLPGPYSINYAKRSNASENDWRDLIGLTRALALPDGPAYADAVRSVADVEAWMRYFAMETFVDNRETNLANGNNGTGQGDDYCLYFGATDSRARLLPYDLDTLLGVGDASFNADEGLFRMLANPTLAKFMRHPPFARSYYRALESLLDGVCSAEELGRLVNEVLGDLAPSSLREAVIAFADARRASIRRQIPDRLTVTNVAPLLQNGVITTGSAGIELRGRAPASSTATVLVGGKQADWVGWQAAWRARNVPLLPGMNRILLQALDDTGHEVDRQFLHVQSTQRSPRSVSGALTNPVAWTPDRGPYRVAGSLTVRSGARLVIHPGTTVELGPDAVIQIEGSGSMEAVGSELQPIRFRRSPGASANGPAVTLTGTGTNATRLEFVEWEGSPGSTFTLRAIGSTVILRHAICSGTQGPFLDLDASAFLVEDCLFPSLMAQPAIRCRALPDWGGGTVRGSTFGTGAPSQPTVECSGSAASRPVLQVLDNVFNGSPHACLGLDGVEALIEGNVFLHARQPDAGTGESTAVLAGAATPCRLTITRNVFHDCDHSLVSLNGGCVVFEFNTSVSNRLSALNIERLPHQTSNATEQDRDLRVAGNIFAGVATNLQVTPVSASPEGFAPASIEHNLASTLQGLTGHGNFAADARLRHGQGVDAPTIRQAFSPRQGSPALAASPLGFDLGASTPAGAVLAGCPPSGQSWRTTWDLTVGGAGITGYRWQLNGGPWSEPMDIAEPLRLSTPPGTLNTLRVIGRNAAGDWQSAASAFSQTWRCDPSAGGIRLGEIMAASRGARSDWIELVNEGGTSVPLDGFRLVAGDPRAGREFQFPSGLTMASSARFVVNAGSASSPGTVAAPFRLHAHGDAVSLFDAHSNLVDRVEFGLQIDGFSIARHPSGDWRLGVPTPGRPNEMAATGEPSQLSISEWLTSDAVVEDGDFIEVANSDVLPVPLDHVALGRQVAAPIQPPSFPSLSFVGAGASLVVHADGAVDKGVDHAPFRLDRDGGEIVLWLDGRILDVALYGPQFPGVSQGRSVPGRPLTFFPTPTPGAPNPDPSRIGSPLINEVFAWNESVPDDDGTWPDWVELYNPSPVPFDLSGLGFSDDPSLPFRFRFPPHTILGPWNHLRLRCDPNNPPSPSNAGFGLNRHGETLYLTDASERDGRLLDSVTFGLHAADFSMARYPDGSTNWILGIPTPGSSNHPSPLGDPGRVRINEWLAAAGAGDDWIELYNPQALPVDISGMRLTDDPGSPPRHAFPPRSFLGTGAGAYAVLIADNHPEKGANHLPFKLNDSGESIRLTAGDGRLMDHVEFGPQKKNVSQGRWPDGGAGFESFPGTPSPGGPNSRDKDSDGMDDAWELRHGLSPDDPSDGDADPDLDGVSNRAEYQANSDPLHPDSPLRLEAAWVGPELLELAFEARPDRTYVIEEAGDLRGTEWNEHFRVPPRSITRTVRARMALDRSAHSGFLRVRVSPTR